MRGSVVALTLCVALSSPLLAQSVGSVVEFPVAYPNVPSVETGACHPAPKGSTHEITFDAKGGNTFWITGQNYDQVVQVTQSGAMTFYPMPGQSGPHGIEFDADRQPRTVDDYLPCPSVDAKAQAGLQEHERRAR